MVRRRKRWEPNGAKGKSTQLKSEALQNEHSRSYRSMFHHCLHEVPVRHWQRTWSPPRGVQMSSQFPLLSEQPSTTATRGGHKNSKLQGLTWENFGLRGWFVPVHRTFRVLQFCLWLLMVLYAEISQTIWASSSSKSTHVVCTRTTTFQSGLHQPLSNQDFFYFICTSIFRLVFRSVKLFVEEVCQMLPAFWLSRGACIWDSGPMIVQVIQKKLGHKLSEDNSQTGVFMLCFTFCCLQIRLLSHEWICNLLTALWAVQWRCAVSIVTRTLQPSVHPATIMLTAAVVSSTLQAAGGPEHAQRGGWVIWREKQEKWHQYIKVKRFFCFISVMISLFQIVLQHQLRAKENVTISHLHREMSNLFRLQSR